MPSPIIPGPGLGVKVYRALLTQTITSDPTATVLENSLGGTVVWTRTSPGDYLGTLSGAFTANKTFPVISGVGSVTGATDLSANCLRTGNNTVQVTTSQSGAGLVDEILLNAAVEILVYPT